jgi:hypothetical protein
VSGEDLLFPSFDYHLDDSDPDIVVLRRQDGSFVAAFSVRGMPGRASRRLPGRATESLCGLIGPG